MQDLNNFWRELIKTFHIFFGHGCVQFFPKCRRIGLGIIKKQELTFNPTTLLFSTLELKCNRIYIRVKRRSCVLPKKKKISKFYSLIVCLLKTNMTELKNLAVGCRSGRIDPTRPWLTRVFAFLKVYGLNVLRLCGSGFFKFSPGRPDSKLRDDFFLK